MFNIATSLRILFVAALLVLLGYTYFLHRENKSLVGYKNAYRIQSNALTNVVTMSKLRTVESVASTKEGLRDILEDNATIKGTLENLNIKLNKVSSLSSSKVALGNNFTGKSTNAVSKGDSIKLLKKENEFSKIEVTYNPKNDSMSVKDSSFANILVIQHHRRKKFLGIGLGRKIYETTVTSNNPNLKIGKVEAYQTK